MPDLRINRRRAWTLAASLVLLAWITLTGALVPRAYADRATPQARLANESPKCAAARARVDGLRAQFRQDQAILDKNAAIMSDRDRLRLEQRILTLRLQLIQAEVVQHQDCLPGPHPFELRTPCESATLEVNRLRAAITASETAVQRAEDELHNHGVDWRPGEKQKYERLVRDVQETLRQKLKHAEQRQATTCAARRRR